MNCPADPVVPSRSCSASSEYSDDWLCENAFDSDPESGCATQGEGVGSWIQSEFGATYRVARFEYRHRILDADNRQITLLFSDGSSQTFTLQDDVNDMQSFAVTPVQSSFVRITVDSVHETLNNGAMEITFYGGLVGRCSNFYLPASCSYPHPGLPLPTPMIFNHPSSPPSFVWNSLGNSGCIASTARRPA